MSVVEDPGTGGGGVPPDLERIAAEAEEADGAAPLDEATWLALRHRPEQLRAWSTGDGVALLRGEELSVLVRPAARGRGQGGRLAAQALAAAGASRLTAWSHADHPAARQLAERHGFRRTRELWVLRRPASAALPRLELPVGVRVRGYRDTDRDALLAVNAASFAAHPEQGAMDAADLAARMAEPWFDADGLLVAEQDGRMLGFHWTKQHSPTVGEVYVVGVAPEAQGRGAGRLLTLAGLHHLAGLGVEEVLLYVESDNAPALALYTGLGFGHAAPDTHVQYTRG